MITHIETSNGIQIFDVDKDKFQINKSVSIAEDVNVLAVHGSNFLSDYLVDHLVVTKSQHIFWRTYSFVKQKCIFEEGCLKSSGKINNLKTAIVKFLSNDLVIIHSENGVYFLVRAENYIKLVFFDIEDVDFEIRDFISADDIALLLVKSKNKLNFLIIDILKRIPIIVLPIFEKFSAIWQPKYVHICNKMSLSKLLLKIPLFKNISEEYLKKLLRLNHMQTQYLVIAKDNSVITATNNEIKVSKVLSDKPKKNLEFISFNLPDQTCYLKDGASKKLLILSLAKDNLQEWCYNHTLVLFNQQFSDIDVIDLNLELETCLLLRNKDNSEESNKSVINQKYICLQGLQKKVELLEEEYGQSFTLLCEKTFILKSILQNVGSNHQNNSVENDNANVAIPTRESSFDNFSFHLMSLSKQFVSNNWCIIAQFKTMCSQTENLSAQLFAVPLYENANPWNSISCCVQNGVSVVRLCAWSDMSRPSDLSSAELECAVYLKILRGDNMQKIIFLQNVIFDWETLIGQNCEGLALEQYFYALTCIQSQIVFVLTIEDNDIVNLLETVSNKLSLQVKHYCDGAFCIVEKPAALNNCQIRFHNDVSQLKIELQGSECQISQFRSILRQICSQNDISLQWFDTDGSQHSVEDSSAALAESLRQEATLLKQCLSSLLPAVSDVDVEHTTENWLHLAKRQRLSDDAMAESFPTDSEEFGKLGECAENSDKALAQLCEAFNHVF